VHVVHNHPEVVLLGDKTGESPSIPKQARTVSWVQSKWFDESQGIAVCFHKHISH
jgi:hypothetical protein